MTPPLAKYESLTNIAVRSSGKAWVDACAKRCFAFFTVSASTVGDIKGHHNSVTLLE